MSISDFDRRDQVSKVLYAEDFDIPVLSPVEPEPVSDLSSAEITTPELYTAEDLDFACRQEKERVSALEKISYEKEKSEWKNSIENNSLNIIKKISDQMNQCAQQEAENSSIAIFSHLAKIFPSLLENYGPRERDVLIDKIMPTLREAARIRIEAKSQEIQHLLTLCEREGVEVIDCRADDTLASGDFRIFWATGKACREAGTLVQEILKIFSLDKVLPAVSAE